MCAGCDILEDGADAADDILRSVYRLDVFKAANPLDPADFLKISGRVARRFRRLATPGEQRAKSAAGAALDIDWPKVSAGTRSGALRDAAKAITEEDEKLMPQLDTVMKVTGPKIVGDTRKAVVSRYKLSIGASTTERDERVGNYVRTSETMFVRDANGRRVDTFSEKARQIVADGLDDGLGRTEISEGLAEALKIAARPSSYWDLIANNFANRARNYTQINSFDDAAIASYVFSAVMDERTSSVCRFMNGREFKVGAAVKRIDSVMKLEEPEEIANTLPWLQEGKNDNGEQILFYERGGRRRTVAVVDQSAVGSRDVAGTFSRAMDTAALERAGLQFPPLHALCRSTVIPSN